MDINMYKTSFQYKFTEVNDMLNSSLRRVLKSDFRILIKLSKYIQHLQLN